MDDWYLSPCARLNNGTVFMVGHALWPLSILASRLSHLPQNPRESKEGSDKSILRQSYVYVPCPVPQISHLGQILTSYFPEPLTCDL